MAGWLKLAPDPNKPDTSPSREAAPSPLVSWGEAGLIDPEWVGRSEAAMRNIEDIPQIPDQATRLAEITVDCYGPDEELSGFEVYFSDALHPPFEAMWRDPDEPGHAERVTVLGVGAVDHRRGILLAVRRQSGKERRVLAEQLWAEDAGSANAIILDDYRAWGGMDLGWDEPS